MRILVLGASGKCGRWATRLAAAEGHTVTAMVRRETRYEAPAGVAIVRGNALDAAELGHAAAGAEAIISCIGPQRESPWNPWSPLREPGGVAEWSVRALLAAGEGERGARIAVISAAGVGDSAAATNWPMRWMLRHSTIGAMYRDLEAMERLLDASGRDWLAVRPVTLVRASPSRRARVVGRYRTTSVIGRGDVAQWMLRWATGAAPAEPRTPMIGWW